MSHPVYLHLGLPKTGTTALQSVLFDNREQLAEQGLLVPYAGPDGHFRAAVDVVGWSLWGVDAARYEGAWRELVEQVRAHDGPAVISHEILGRAKRPRIDFAFQALEGLDVHLVVTARDLARQVTAVWQERIKNGRRYDFESFLEAEGVHNTAGPDRRQSYFWREQDLIHVVRKWAERVPPGNVHVVTCPPPGAADDELVRRFFGVLGVDPSGLEAADRAANRSLGLADVELLRRVNIAVHDHVSPAEYVAVVKRGFAKRMLGHPDGTRAVAPEPLRPVFEEVTRSWRRGITKRGYTVHGDLAELDAMTFEGDTLPEVPDDVLVADLPRLVAELLVSVSAQRTAAADAAATQSETPAATNPPRWRDRLLGRNRT